MAAIDDSATVQDFVIQQGDDWSRSFRRGTRADAEAEIEYVDLTGWTGACHFRQKANATDVLAELDVEIDPDQVTNKGLITITLSAEDAATLPTKRPLVWDLELTSPAGLTRTYLRGEITVIAEVTR